MPAAPIGRPEAVDSATVDKLAALKRQGYGWRMIAAKMNAAGIATVGGGRKWWPGTVRAILLRYPERWEGG